MRYCLTTALLAAIFVLALRAPSTPAQRRGIAGGRRAGHEGNANRVGDRDGGGRAFDRRGFNQSGLFLGPYFFDDFDYDSEHYLPAGYPVQVVVEQPTPAPVASAVPAMPPADAMVLEKRDGQWVRVPNGNQVPTATQSTEKQATDKQVAGKQGTEKQQGSSPAGKLHPGISDPADGMKAAPELPAAVLVFRDGHKEELQKYMIQGDAIYTSSNAYTPGALTKRIPLSELDIPASLKLNKDRGTGFSLPSASNEVVIRF